MENSTLFTEMFTKLSRMPKAKALAAINAQFPDYEATEVYTVRDNLTAAIAQAEAIAAAQPVLAGEMDDIEAPKSEKEQIAALLAALAAEGTTKNEKKNLRAKLRRLGYYVSSAANAQAADIAQDLPAAE